MDAMFWMQLIVVVIAIGIGAKWGGLGLGAAGGLGLFVLVFFFGLKPGNVKRTNLSPEKTTKITQP